MFLVFVVLLHIFCYSCFLHFSLLSKLFAFSHALSLSHTLPLLRVATYSLYHSWDLFLKVWFSFIS